MLKPVNFPQSNHKLGPPVGLTEEQCATIHVYAGENVSSQPVVISCWEISDADIEILIRERKLFVHVFGFNMPPIALTTNPFV